MWTLFAVVGAYVLGLQSVLASGGLASRIVPQVQPLTIPFHNLHARAPLANATARAGVTALSMSSDRQSYFAVLETGQIKFRVALDTGSSDLWIMSSACETEACKGAPRYPLAYQSPTFLAVNGNNTAFRASYADGTFASGFVAQESIQLSNLTLENQNFALVTDSNMTTSDQISGIMGLGFPRLSSISSTTNSTPFFVGLAQRGLLDYPLFCFSLTRNSSGTLSIGAVDASIVTNASLIGWNQVSEFAPFGAESNASSYLQWAIPLSSFSVNGVELTPQPTYPDKTKASSLALIDIGASGIYGPFADVSRLFGMIDGSRLVDSEGQWVVPCDTVVPIAFKFGLQNFTLQPSDYLIGPASENPNLCLSWPRAHPPSSDGIDWQMGSAFLRTVYSIFSYGINTKEPPFIGFYPLPNSTIPETPAEVASILSSISATVGTALPNFPLPTPTYTTPPYAFNTSGSTDVGGIATSGLATSTYKAIIAGKGGYNASLLPTILPPPTVTLLVITNAEGLVTTSTSTPPIAMVTLGIPPGWSAGTSLRIPKFDILVVPCVLVSLTMVFAANFIVI